MKSRPSIRAKEMVAVPITWF